MAKKQLSNGDPLVANAPLGDAALSTKTAPAPQNNPKKANNKQKNKKPSFFKRIGKSFKEMFSEMKKIVWATPMKVATSLLTVLVVVFVCAVLVVGFDTLWAFLLDLLLTGSKA